MASNASLHPGSHRVHKKSSNQSMKSVKKVASDISLNVNHSKAATAPADMTSDSTTIVDSPSDIKPPVPIPPTLPAVPSEKPHTNQRNNTETGSTNGKSHRPWRRSTTRKPTGLASAIAASGLAMANPASHQPQMSPPAIISPQQSIGSATSKKSIPPPGSPSYMSLSSSQSVASQKHQGSRSPNLSTRSLKPKKSANGSSKGSTPKKSSGSVNSDNGSENGARPEYYSGLDDSSDEDESGSELDIDDLELGDNDIPVTGFAVASNKRNADFHELFPTVPEGDYLIEDYGCALQREILIQGRLYISENHICFHANIFGWLTDLSFPIYEITSLEKKMTAFVIPNAIQFSTRQSKYTFASFLSRDTTFDVIYNIWRLARPEDAISIGSRGRSSTDGHDIGAAGSNGTIGGGVAVLGVGVTAGIVAPTRKATMCTCGKEGKHYTETALDTVIPGTPDRIHNLMFASGFMKDFMAGNQKLLDIQMSDWSPVSPGSKLLTRNMSYIKPLTGSLGPKQTKCEITDEIVHVDFDHYVSTMTTTRTPEVPSGGVFSVKTKTCVMWASPVSSRVVVTTQVEWTGRSFIKGIIERSAIDGQKVYHSDLEKAMRVYIQEHQTEFLPEGIEPIVIDLAATLPEPIGAIGVKPESLTHKRIQSEDEFKQRERERNQRGLQWAWDTFEGASQVAKQSFRGALELIRDAWDQSSSTTILWFVIVILVLSNLWTLIRMGASRDEVSRRLESRKVEEREKWVQSIVTALWDELASGKKEANVFADPVLQPQRERVSMYPTTTSIIGDQDAQQVTMMSVAVPVETSPLAPPVVRSTSGELKGWEEEIQHLHKTLDAVEEKVKVIRERLTVFKNLDSLD